MYSITARPSCPEMKNWNIHETENKYHDVCINFILFIFN